MKKRFKRGAGVDGRYVYAPNGTPVLAYVIPDDGRDRHHRYTLIWTVNAKGEVGDEVFSDIGAVIGGVVRYLNGEDLTPTEARLLPQRSLKLLDQLKVKYEQATVSTQT